MASKYVAPNMRIKAPPPTTATALDVKSPDLFPTLGTPTPTPILTPTKPKTPMNFKKVAETVRHTPIYEEEDVLLATHPKTNMVVLEMTTAQLKYYKSLDTEGWEEYNHWLNTVRVPSYEVYEPEYDYEGGSCFSEEESSIGDYEGPLEEETDEPFQN
jgi:hypothetical protein